MDIVTPDKRSEIMSKIAGKNTKPELALRSLLHGMGYRYRLHKKELPGKPDIVLSKYKTIIFLHGCYWHRHTDCSKGQSIPSSNTAFWLEKFDKNCKRDKKNIRELKKLGWTSLIIWECELKNPDKLKTKISKKICKN